MGRRASSLVPSATGQDYELPDGNLPKVLEPWREFMTIVGNADVRMAEAFEAQEVGGATRSARRLNEFLAAFREKEVGATYWQPTPSRVQAATKAAHEIQRKWPDVSDPADDDKAEEEESAARGHDCRRPSRLCRLGPPLGRGQSSIGPGRRAIRHAWSWIRQRTRRTRPIGTWSAPSVFSVGAAST